MSAAPNAAAAPAPRCDETPAWAALAGHFEAHAKPLQLREAFARDPDRVARFTRQAPEVLADWSRCLIDAAAQRYLLELAEQCRLPERRDAMLAGRIVNASEGRAAWHSALRAPDGSGPPAEVAAMRERFLAFAESVRAQARQRTTDIVNIGIGGSDLGPRLAIGALQESAHPGLRLHFVSNLDPLDLQRVLAKVDPQRTLFVVVSKTFTTLETMANAHAARAWLQAQGIADVGAHFVAVTSNVEAASAFGIPQTFGFWDWVGGRYSVWSAVGLSLAIAIGAEGFRDFLAGGHAMDRHFAETAPADNLPMLLGLLDVWHRNFWQYPTRCVVPYHHGLREWPAYLQQLEMESNGKCVAADGRALRVPTAPVVWGVEGTNGQHSFFQMLHQGTQAIPVEFVLVRQGPHSRPDAQRALLACALAQAEALMEGRDLAASAAQPAPAGALPAAALAGHRVVPGNRPSTLLLLEAVTPRSLGAWIALHEHRVWTSGALWGINSFDQWGVELGKTLGSALDARLRSGDVQGLDAATAAWVTRLKG